MDKLTRRRVLGVIGVGALTASTLPMSATAREEGELPNDTVKYTDVLPFNCTERSFCDRPHPQTVPVGDWVLHTWSWIPTAYDDEGHQCGGAAEQKEYLDNHLSNANWTVWIDGEKIDNAEQYWSKVYSEEFNQWILRWEYATPPKNEGTHTFTRNKTVTERHRVGWEEESCDPRYLAPGESVSPTTGQYVVTDPED